MRFGKFIGVVGLVFLLVFVSAGNQSFSVSYDFFSNSSYSKTVDFGDVLIKVMTDYDAICKWSGSSGVDYADMENVFDSTGGVDNRLNLIGLGDGNYKYYVKCKSYNFSGEPGELKISLRVNSLVSGQVVLDKDAPLKEGRIGVSLIVSKFVSNTPSLKYSVDGSVYNPVVLVGDGLVWKGSILLEDIGEGVLSFKFSANDLEGRAGSRITSGAYFDFDTKRPGIITDIDVEEVEGGLKLRWYLDEDVDSFLVYRSNLEGVDYIDYYKSVDDEEFVDYDVEKGKVYYYRVVGVDSAGNEGDMSREVYGSVSGGEDAAGGLSLNLVGRVNALLVDVDSLIEDIEYVKEKNNDENDLFYLLGFGKIVDDSLREVSSLRGDVERLKKQDLDEGSLDSRLNSYRVKLGVIEKKVPASLLVKKEDEKKWEFSEESVFKSIRKVFLDIDEREASKSVRLTEDFAKELGVGVVSDFYDAEVEYLDGRVSEISVIRREIDGVLVDEKNSYFIDILPDGVLVDDIKMIGRSYESAGGGEVLLFPVDVREVFYYMPKISFEDLVKSEFNYAVIYRKEGSAITGFSILSAVNNVYLDIGVLIVFGLIFSYFLFFRKGGLSDDYFRVVNRVSGAVEKLDEGDVGYAKECYLFAKKKYSKLNKKEKKELYKLIDELYQDILIEEIKKDLGALSGCSKGGEKANWLIRKIDKKISMLPQKKRDIVLSTFDKIKKSLIGG